ncbi:MAG: hypothetical protein K0Q71_1614 [Thermomicrobiales bacterium]|jgi:hypothetical protein|nr:hypothetical protein [Thermomicrobiales bacterium]
MSYPYPQDRQLDRTEGGEQPYKDAREAMGQQDAEIQPDAEAFGESQFRQAGEEPGESLAQRVTERLREVGDEIARSEDRESRD